LPLEIACYEMHVVVIMVIISCTLKKFRKGVASFMKIPKGITDRTRLRNIALDGMALG